MGMVGTGRLGMHMAGRDKASKGRVRVGLSAGTPVPALLPLWVGTGHRGGL